MNQYIKLKAILANGQGFKEFSHKLHHSNLKNQSYLLGLLLIHLVQLNKIDFQLYFQALLDCGANPNFVEPKGQMDSKLTLRSVLMIACQKSNNETVKVLLKAKKINPLLEDSDNQNILFYALRNEDEEQAYKILQTIIEIFPDLPSKTSNKNRNLVTMAVGRKASKLLDLLLRNNCNPNFQIQKTGNTALHEILSNLQLYSENQLRQFIPLLLKYGTEPGIKNGQEEDCFCLASKHQFDLKKLVIESEEGQKQKYSESEFSQNEATKDEDIISRNTDDLIKEALLEISSEEDDDDGDTFCSPETLSKEIEDYVKVCEKELEKAWEDIQYLYSELQKMGEKLKLKIDIIGSYAYGLWTPESDIDIIYVNVGEHYPISDILKKIYEVLKMRQTQYGIQKMYFNSDLKFPNISIHLTSKFNRRKIDIAAFQYRNNGEKYVTFIKAQLSLNPFIQPLFFVFRKILKNFKLNNPTKGGVKTYALFLMIWFAISCFPASSVGQALINVVLYFNYQFQYEEGKDETGEYVCRLNIIDPINQTNNVGGRYTETEKLQSMFKTLQYGLRLKLETGEEQLLSYLFQLNKIFIE